ncbi:MAG: MBL fold metallo-hydrolase RNA specificity domain-containing protein, partial [Clostridiales bacterium]
LGRRLIDGEKKVTIHGEEIDVRAEIINMDGFSAHADKNELVAWLDRFEKMPSRIFVVHGEEQSALEFADTVNQRYSVATVVPQMGDIVELTAEAVVLTANRDFAKTVIDENILVDINTALQKITMGHDIEQLIRVRDFLKRIV